ncbi:MAG: hypothetical protein WAV86_07720 [Lutibacter sp.]
MKKIILFTIFAIGFNAYAQVELKGIMIGSKFKGSQKDLMVRTSVAEINGEIFIAILKDSTISGVMFLPIDENNNELKISEVDEERVKLGMEKKYGITFIKELNDSPLVDYFYKANKDGIKYVIVITKNKYLVNSIGLNILIYNDELAKRGDREKQKKVNNDF